MDIKIYKLMFVFCREVGNYMLIDKVYGCKEIFFRYE